jgi:hypothetical protein
VKENEESVRQVWIAYHSDWSGFALFDTEIEALRHAIATGVRISSDGRLTHRPYGEVA